MKVLFVSHNYPRFPSDPAGGYVQRLARGAARHGAVVHVLTPHVPETPLRESEGALTVERFRYDVPERERIGYTGDPRTSWRPSLALPLARYLWRFRESVARATREFEPDVTHAHWWIPSGWFATRQAVPCVVTCHGTDVRLLDRRGPLRWIARSVLSRAAVVTTVSRSLAADIGSVYSSLPPARVTPMPIDVERFRQGRETPKVDPPQILYAGNLVPAKGVDLLVRAFAILRRRGIRCRLRVIGRGPSLANLRSLARDEGMEAEIDWSDLVPQDRMPAQYGASTVNVLVSRGSAEGLGLSLVEALLAGCAVVGSTAGGIPEVIEDGQTGFLVRDGDVEGLAGRLEQLLGDAELRHRLTETGARRMGETYDQERCTETFLGIYREACDRHEH